jgi:LCP family protein required for cell wall assembly
MKKNQIIAVCLLIFGLVGIGIYKWLGNLTEKVFVSPVASLRAATAAAALRNQGNVNLISERFSTQSPVNFLLLGYGGATHDGTYLTDSIMVLNLNPKTSKATLISIPRDIWVGNKKINSFYSQHIKEGPAVAGRAAMDAVSQVTGLNMDRFVSVSFDGFTKTIDALGGVDVKVDVTFDDYQYPIEGKEDDLCGKDPAELPAITATASATKNPELIFPCRYKHLHFDAGTVHMDGITALEFVRSRHSAQDGSDFGRSRRQKNLLVAVKQKVMSVNFITSALPFINRLGDEVRTDLSLDEARVLISTAGKLADYKISSLAITDENYLISSQSTDGQYVLIPKAGADNWTEVHTWIENQTKE